MSATPSPPSASLTRGLAFAFALASFGCLPDEAAVGLAPTPMGGTGPQVVFDLDRRPVPDVPFPSDLLTRPDANSPTGLRLNLSLQAPSRAEQALRAEAQTFDGFSTTAAISVRFDAPLDLDGLAGAGRDPADDPVLVLDVSPGSTFGERIPVDLGRGYFPVAHADPTAVAFPRDPRGEASNLIFETVDEDTDGDGVLDPMEDTDGDGVLDRPNVWPEGGDPERDVLTFYERQTNTLLLRPIVPLRPGRRYAVVLTRAIVGLDGAPIRSPFEYIHHTGQNDALNRLPEALGGHGVSPEAVAFAWAFTTQSATRELQALRDGLRGDGPFAWLDTCVPSGLIEPGDPDVLVARGPALTEAVRAWLAPRGEAAAAAVVAEWAAVSHLVAGSIGVPYLLADGDLPTTLEPSDLLEPGCVARQADIRRGLRPVPADDDEVWRVDVDRATIRGAVLAEVNFWCTVPTAGDGAQAPFPVVVYGHDHGGSRLDAFVAAGRWAAQGLATCAVDAVGHGPVGLPSSGDEALDTVAARHRARDLDGDGVLDPGADTFGISLLHTRDVIRQSALDWIALIRVLRSFDGQRGWRTQPTVVASDIAGDFDDDGRVDLGGPAVGYHVAGEGLGGALAAIVAGVEPAVTAVAPISPMSSLTDVFLRSAAPAIAEGVVLPALGPIVVGLPEVGPSGQRRRGTLVTVWAPVLGQVLHSDPEAQLGTPIVQLPPLDPGQLVVLTNLSNGSRAEGRVREDGGFRLSVVSDALTGSDRQTWIANDRPITEVGDLIRLEVPGLDPPTRVTFDYPATVQGVTFETKSDLQALATGWGFTRQTPGFRQFSQLVQTALDPADPVNYARGILPPVEGGASTDAGTPGADVLLVLTAGDRQAPIAGGLSLGRAAGLWDLETPVYDGQPLDALLIGLEVTRGLARLETLADVDLLSDATDGFDVRRLDPPLRYSSDRGERGRSALRIALLDPAGSHGLGLPAPEVAWDGHSAMLDLIGRFFATGAVD